MTVRDQESVDPALVLRAQQGDMSAHEGLYRAFSRGVYTLARRILLSPSLAEDVLQETFVEVIRNIHTFRGEAPLGHWIRRVAANKCRMHLRSAWNARRDSLDEPERLEADPANPAAALDLADALVALTPTARTVVWLHDVEGFTHAEIGRLMDKSTSFSKSQLARAHERLRQMLNPESESESCESALKTS